MAATNCSVTVIQNCMLDTKCQTSVVLRSCTHGVGILTNSSWCHDTDCSRSSSSEYGQTSTSWRLL